MAFPIAGAFTKWPNGANGDLTVTQTNEFIDFSQSSTPLNYRNLTINSGCTLWIRVTDGYPAIIGVAGNLTVNGTLRIVDKFTDSSWPTATLLSRTIPSLNNEVFSWTTPGERTGGGTLPLVIGGLKGFGYGGRGGIGDFVSPGNGGGYNQNGENGNTYTDGAPVTAGLGGTNSTNASNGFNNVSRTQAGNGGGRNYDNGEFGGSGSGCGGGGGGSVARPSYDLQGRAAGGGGSGGWPGRHGAALYIFIAGFSSGLGTINLSGENGRAGFNGGNGYVISNTYTGIGGGGGAGGSGGKLEVRHINGFSGIVFAVSAGTGGAGGTGGGYTAQAGQNGTNGTTNITTL